MSTRPSVQKIWAQPPEKGWVLTILFGVGLFHLRSGLSYFRLVLVADENLAWSFLLTVELWFGLLSIQWKIGLVFFTYGFGLLCLWFQKFRKGLADKRGWRQEILPVPEIEASFLHPFAYAPLGEGEHISGELFCLLFWAPLVANPLPSTPFRNLSWFPPPIRKEDAP